MTGERHPRTNRIDYGLDAPGVVRNLLCAGALGLIIGGLAIAGLIPRELVARIGPVAIRFPLVSSGWTIGVSCTAVGLWMIWTSRVGKIREREQLLQHIEWTGHERVLDVGCGRGLMLIGAARRLTTGRATGIDIWQAEDLSGNRPEGTLANAQLEGVADRLDVQTADMRAIPFPGATFDIVVSCAAIHNLYSPDDRAQAIREIARVLKPGGQALIADIRHHGEYAATFRGHGCPEVRRIGSRAALLLWTVVTMGSVRPETLIARKAG